MSISIYAFVPMIVICSVTGCGGDPSRLEPADLDPANTAERAVKLYDLNHDGKIGEDELTPALKTILSTADTNHDEALSQAEIAQRLQIHVDSKTALQSVSGPVRWNGRPLTQVNVTLVPDPIFENLEPASGVTDESGIVDFQIDGEELPGVRPGLYRIEVSKKNENGKELMPAKYNTNTELGIEIGVPGSPEGGMAAESFLLDLRG